MTEAESGPVRLQQHYMVLRFSPDSVDGGLSRQVPASHVSLPRHPPDTVDKPETETASDESEKVESDEPSDRGSERRDLRDAPDDTVARLVPWLPLGLTMADAFTTFEALEAVVKPNTEDDVKGFVDVLESARTSVLALVAARAATEAEAEYRRALQAAFTTERAMRTAAERSKSTAVDEKETAVLEKEAAVSEKEAAVAEKEAAMTEKESF